MVATPLLQAKVMRSKILVAAVLATVSPLAIGNADDSALKWKDRGNRYEGIKDRPVGGERFDFVGIHVPGGLAGDSGSLFLSIPPTCRIGEVDRVDVRDDRVYYWMTPKHKESLARSPFEWQTGEVLRQAGAELDDLRVTVRNETTGTYCPARLSASPRAPHDRGYVFTFRTPADVSLEWGIVSLESGDKVASGETFGDRRSCEIRWEGDAPSGIYQLRVTGRGESDDGEFKIGKAVDFLHPAEWP